MEDVLTVLTTATDGVFTRTQARALGVSDHRLRMLVRRGEVRRVRAGAYALPVAITEKNRATAADEDYLLRVRAIVAARLATTKVWASHHAGLAVHGLPLHGVDLTHVDVASRDVDHARLRDGVRVVPLPKDEPAMIVHGVPVCSVATCLVQTAAVSGLEAGLVAMDAALHAELVSAGELRSRIEHLGRFRGVPRARAALAQSDPAAESVGESRTRLLLSGLGIPCRSQVEILGSDGEFLARVDFLVDERVIVEFDGAVKYAGASGRAAIVAEKAREDRLRAEGYEVVRLVWSDLDAPDRVATLVRQARWRADCRAKGLPV